MKCPFLKEASVRYCEASAYRKMLRSDATSSRTERCSTAGWAECPAALPRIAGHPPQDRCPFLHEAQAEYCGAASVTKFIPATNDFLSRCNSDGHFYCELFLAHADPQGDRRPCRSGSASVEGMPSVDGVPVPPHLHYTPNHMWLDISDDGSWHIGIDAFAAKVLGSVERVTFVAQRVQHRPTAVLRVNGVDVPMIFPEPHAVAPNFYLRTATARLTDDPYGAGWLFECVEPPSVATIANDESAAGMVSGSDAVAWMSDEMKRLNDFAHERISRPDADGTRYVADGGTVEDGLATYLNRDDLIDLVSEFFTVQTEWRRSS